MRDGATEAQIQAAIHDYLNAQRIPHSITDATQSFNHKGQRVKRVSCGWPDVTACLPTTGRMFAIECKSAKKYLRPDQARTLYALFMAGATVCVARSVDDVIETLQSGQRIRMCDYEEIFRYKDRIEKKRRRA